MTHSNPAGSAGSARAETDELIRRRAAPGKRVRRARLFAPPGEAVGVASGSATLQAAANALREAI